MRDKGFVVIITIAALSWYSCRNTLEAHLGDMPAVVKGDTIDRHESTGLRGEADDNRTILAYTKQANKKMARSWRAPAYFAALRTECRGRS